MQTVLFILSAVFWVAAAVCVPSAIRGRRRPLLLFLAVFALTMTLMPQPVYRPVDALLGNGNVTYFIFHALTIVAIALLDVIVQEAMSPRGLTRARKRATSLVTSGIIVAQAILFFGSDWRVTDDIAASFIPRWDFTAYAATTWIAMGIFAVSFAIACLADLRRQRRPVTLISLSLVLLACLGVLTYAVISLTSAVLAVFYADYLLVGWARTAYTLTLLLSPISLVIGLGLTAAVDALAAGRENYRDRVLLWRITPLWRRLLSDTPHLSIERQLSPRQLLTVSGPGAHLYRRHVEIRDSLLLRPEQAVTPAELVIIELAEQRTQVGLPATPAALVGPTR
ncbi:hypothetical protein SAMN05216368_103112 [Cryobacterium flavum]|uniref:DUF6545 domain-containing protein n=1 Tax=Cryobacterium flavum TaxID=1424659 RepID=A0A4R8UWD0_9MICO|nr:DUF6545 domain-containing protein [Cryobacterium flavum]TFB73138.1 hypothetical protein E3O21_18950 [Cryobacterium flavum]SDM97619.1 hypothetical protein SAMN05216368_103112 [Cryobacterium flavum]